MNTCVAQAGQAQQDAVVGNQHRNYCMMEPHS